MYKTIRRKSIKRKKTSNRRKTKRMKIQRGGNVYNPGDTIFLIALDNGTWSTARPDQVESIKDAISHNFAHDPIPAGASPGDVEKAMRIGKKYGKYYLRELYFIDGAGQIQGGSPLQTIFQIRDMKRWNHPDCRWREIFTINIPPIHDHSIMKPNEPVLVP